MEKDKYILLKADEIENPKDYGVLKEVTRTIKFTFPKGNLIKNPIPIKQTVIFTRKAKVDSIKNKLIGYTTWEPEVQTFFKRSVPHFNGLEANIKEVPEKKVTHQDYDEVFEIRYVEVAQNENSKDVTEEEKIQCETIIFYPKKVALLADSNSNGIELTEEPVDRIMSESALIEKKENRLTDSNKKQKLEIVNQQLNNFFSSTKENEKNSFSIIKPVKISKNLEALKNIPNVKERLIKLAQVGEMNLEKGTWESYTFKY